ncbi:LacI family DNA-binding transcriptional regulator [Oryzifoliimicrobium ureilyticus]|uniref:LacI family DNA-binding transcriptional regulator n=1 Tax=Oryzifoliimicrobium ureilyticus TaxID=3113724 RepID=UPI003075F31A
MEDFSEFVGLSRPTVSKYFNDPTSVRKKTRDAIEVAIKKSGFSPNMFAVNLNRRRSNIVGVVIPNSTDPFYMALTRRIERIATDAGFLAFILSSDGSAELEERAIRTLKSMNVAGAIIAPLGVDSHHKVLGKLGNSVPIVYVDSPIESDTSSFVGTDNRQSFGLIVDYLCRSGEPPCYLGMPRLNTNAVTRQKAYEEAMVQFGLGPKIILVRETRSWEFEAFGFEEMSRLISEGRALPSRTVLCANDRIAFGAIAAAFQNGLRVGHGPECDLRIAGHDDHPLSRYACPPITTVAQNYNEIGRLAMDMLLEKIEAEISSRGAEDRQVLLKAELMLRSSA